MDESSLSIGRVKRMFPPSQEYICMGLASILYVYKLYIGGADGPCLLIITASGRPVVGHRKAVLK